MDGWEDYTYLKVTFTPEDGLHEYIGYGCQSSNKFKGYYDAGVRPYYFMNNGTSFACGPAGD